MYHAQPRGKVGSTTVPSKVFPAAAAALWHAAASTIRNEGAGQSLLPLTANVYTPTQQSYRPDLECIGQGPADIDEDIAPYRTVHKTQGAKRHEPCKHAKRGTCPGQNTPANK